jgi:hypothetical protein
MRPQWAEEADIEPELLSDERRSYLVGLARGLVQARGGRPESEVRQIGAAMMRLLAHIAYVEGRE